MKAAKFSKIGEAGLLAGLLKASGLDGITTDLDGNARFVDMPKEDTGNGTPPIVDMGAYERQTVIIGPAINLLLLFSE